jgi:hypothetical protein
MPYYDHLNISHLPAKKVPYDSLLMDLNDYPISTHVDRAKRLNCGESNIRRMLKILERLHEEYEIVLKEIREKRKPFVYNPNHVYGFDAGQLAYQLKKINEFPELKKYLPEEAQELLVFVIKDLKNHPISTLNERIKRLCLIKTHTFTRYSLWSLIFWIKWLYKRAEAYTLVTE